MEKALTDLAMTDSGHNYQLLGKEVTIGSVDKELRVLWEQDKASTNASLINLAVYSEADGAILRNSELVQEITREHACRAILIGIDRDNPDASIRAWITAHCHLSHGRKSVCCEQVAFQLTGRATGRLRNTVFAHLNSDLPLVFWWQGELSPIFSERLYSLIDRFVFDSSEWGDPVASFKRIETALQDAEELLPMDMEWTRSYAVRLALAGLYDDPLAAKELEHTSSVRIRVNPGHRMAGLQMLAWIVQRTGWTRSPGLGLGKEGGDQYFFETREGSDVTAVIEMDPASAPVGGVEILSPSSTVKVTREAGSPYLQQLLEVGCHRIEQSTPAGCDDPAELFMDQLSRGGKNTLYRMMIPTFLNFLGVEEDGIRRVSVR